MSQTQDPSNATGGNLPSKVEILSLMSCQNFSMSKVWKPTTVSTNVAKIQSKKLQLHIFPLFLYNVLTNKIYFSRLAIKVRHEIFLIVLNLKAELEYVCFSL
jgi:hypothetical protein